MEPTAEQSYRKHWVSNNKDKLALYARKQYEKRINEDPEYRTTLALRTHMRRQRLREAKPITEKPEQPAIETQPKRPNGRPRKY